MTTTNSLEKLLEVVEHIGKSTEWGRKTVKGTYTYTLGELLGRLYCTIVTRDFAYLTRSNNIRKTAKSKLKDKVIKELRHMSYEVMLNTMKEIARKKGYMIREDSCWIYFNSKIYAKQGLKLHISLPETLPADYTSIILSYLISIEADFKIIRNKKSYNELNKTRQKGKAIVIYTRSLEEAVTIANAIYDFINTIADFILPIKAPEITDRELRYRGCPYIGGRFSRYNGGFFEINGRKISDSTLRYNKKLQKELAETFRISHLFY